MQHDRPGGRAGGDDQRPRRGQPSTARGTARRSAAGMGPSPSASAAAARLGVEVVGVLAQPVGGAGQRRGDPGTQRCLQRRRTARARDPCVVQGGLVLRVGPRFQPVGRARGGGLGTGEAEKGAGVAPPRDGIPERERAPAAGPGPEHLLACVVAGVAQEHEVGPGRFRGPLERACGPGCRLGPQPDGSTATVTTSTAAIRYPSVHVSPVRCATSRKPGCGPWSTTTAPAMTGELRARTPWRRPPARESAPPLQATRTRAPGGTGWTARAHGKPHAATTGRRPRHARVTRGRGRPTPRAPQSHGAAEVPGEAQTRLNPSIPTSSMTARTNAAPSRYWRIFASRPSRRRGAASKAPTPWRRW